MASCPNDARRREFNAMAMQYAESRLPGGVHPSGRVCGFTRKDWMKGRAIDEAEVAREIAPCFVEQAGRRTDQIVLACTHFPLLTDRFVALAPWPVAFVDPAPAIARRVDALLGPPRGARRAGPPFPALFTSGRAPTPAMRKALLRFGLGATSTLGIPLPVLTRRG